MATKYTFEHARAIRGTGKALLIQFGAPAGAPRWVPSSQIHNDSEVFDVRDNSVGRLVLKSWVVEKEKWGNEADDEQEDEG